jgi:hypothetical protein
MVDTVESTPEVPSKFRAVVDKSLQRKKNKYKFPRCYYSRRNVNVKKNVKHVKLLALPRNDRDDCPVETTEWGFKEKILKLKTILNLVPSGNKIL